MKLKAFVLFVLLLIFLVGCFPTTVDEGKSVAGFFMGIWHGWIAPISLIIGLLNDNVRIYETNNSGWWYDFGFYIAIIAGFGSISLFRKKR